MQGEILVNPQGTMRLGDFLLSGLRSRRWTEFRMAVAFVKRSGVKHVASDLRAFADRGGSIRASVGIDAGGTSYEGLRSLRAACPGLWVFHNANGSTFHPKIFMFSDDEEVQVSIGSGNLTEGGLYTNYEANLILRLRRGDPGSSSLISALTSTLDRWSSPQHGLCCELNDVLIERLRSSGLVPDERDMQRGRPGGSGVTGEAALFARHPVAPPPQALVDETGDGLDDENEDPGIVAIQPPPAAAQAGRSSVFLMTLQRTDVGVGQTSSGTARRSPEIFIPLAARDQDPEFWGWPGLFVPDPNWSGAVDGAGRGKMDRVGVMVRLGGATFPVTFWYNPVKRDLRLRSENLRSAGSIGDILYVERSDGTGGFTYYMDVVPSGSPKHVDYLSRCTMRVRNSAKVYGYV